MDGFLVDDVVELEGKLEGVYVDFVGKVDGVVVWLKQFLLLIDILFMVKLLVYDDLFIFLNVI